MKDSNSIPYCTVCLTIIHVHPWAVGVEYSGHTYINVVSLRVGVHESLSYSLTLIVTSSGTNSINMTPVGLLLGMLLVIRIIINIIIIIVIVNYFRVSIYF